MKTQIAMLMTTLVLATPVMADGHATGDAAEGEKVFRKCKSCHMIVDADGNDIQKGGRTGPNLYGIYQRQPGSVEDFRYGDSLVEAGEVLEGGWDEENFVAYVADPRGWLRETLDDNGARSKMSFRLRDEDDAKNLWAYLVSVGPEVTEASDS
ncbi:c-type cytochrome [Pseudaestuariivita sp.]|uniref:c-type cytochrome n=1 Tax=Pseudaestuariivita sp. TaxID=2211669 RepID=UPI00405A1FCF